MPRVVRSRSADGATIAALLPPSSSSERPKRSATLGPTERPIRVEPVALSNATPGSSTSASPTVGVAEDHLAEVGRGVALRDRLLQQRVGGQRAQRRLLRRLPHNRVATDQRDGRVPRPDGDREVEGRDDPDHAERVPGLHQPVAGPLGGHRAAEELSRQADGVVADVDHLLHLAARLGGDLADLETDQGGQVVAVGGEQLAEALDDRSPHRRGDQPPLGVRLPGAGHRGPGAVGVGPGQRGDGPSVDGGEADLVARIGGEVDAARGGRGLRQDPELRLGGEAHALTIELHTEPRRCRPRTAAPCSPPAPTG